MFGEFTLIINCLARKSLGNGYQSKKKLLHGASLCFVRYNKIINLCVLQTV